MRRMLDYLIANISQSAIEYKIKKILYIQLAAF